MQRADPAPAPVQATGWLSSAAGFLPGLLLAAAAGLAPGPWLLLPWLLAQPLLAAAAVRALGYQFEPSLAGSAWRRGVPALLLWCAALLVLVLLAGAPFWRVLETAALGWVLGFSAALTVAWLLLWRAWPAPALPFLWEPAPALHGPWPWATAAGCVAFARRILLGGEAGAARGLLSAAAVLLLLAGPAALATLAWRGSTAMAAPGWMVLALLAAPLHLLVVATTAGALCGAPRRRRRQPVVEAQPVGPAGASEVPVVSADPREALHQWARCGRIDEALALIEADVDVHALPASGARDQRTLAMLAAVQSDLRLLRALIVRGVDINRVHAGLTPLLAATRDSWHGRPEAVTTLLANGADPRATDAEGSTPLHHAARSGDPGVAAQLIDAGAAIDAPNRSGLTPLGAACACGNWRLARFLLDRGARAEPVQGQPPLLAAAAGDDDAAGVTLLLKHKAKVDSRGPFERSALMAACLAGNREIVEVLLDAGADVNARDAHGVTPLLEAARAGANAVLRALAARKADATARDAAGRSALLIACQSARANGETVALLLALGVDRDAVDGDGRTPLEVAIAGGRWALVAALDPTHALPTTVTAQLDGRCGDQPPAELLHRALADGDLPRAGAVLALGSSLDAAGINAVFEALAGDGAGVETLRWLARRGVVADAMHPAGGAAPNGCDVDDGLHGADGDPPAADAAEPSTEQHPAQMAPESMPVGDSLMFRLLDQGGAAAAALTVLLEQGAAPAGRGGLARFLDACVAGEHTARGHESLALQLLERGADPFAAARSGEPPLLGAVRLGWPRLAQALLAGGLDVHTRDGRGATALHLACAMGLEPLVRELVRFGACPGARAPDGQTPQGLALAAGRRDLSRWLCWKGWQPPARALRAGDVVKAAQAGDRDAVERLLALDFPLDARDAQGCTPLLRACGGGHAELARWLLARGADADHAAASGATCLSAAISTDQAGIAEALLEHGAAVDRRLPGGVTPLLVAAALGRPALVALLIARGATVNLRDEQGNTALLAAAQFAFAARQRGAAQVVFERLLAAGADADARNRAGLSALLLLLGANAEAGATCDEDALVPLLDLLLAHGAELQVQEQQRGFGPLHLSALHGLGRCVQRLLAAGADPCLRDGLNRTPHDIALMRGFIDIAQAFGPAQPAPSIARFLRPPEG